jgi:hypothetical protein
LQLLGYKSGGGGIEREGDVLKEEEIIDWR